MPAKYLLPTVIFLAAFNPKAWADDTTDLAKKAQNPVENMISVPLQNQFNFSYGPHQNTQFLLEAKPVVPFSLTPSLNLITRTIIPLAHQPNLYVGRNDINAIGDLNPSFYFSPANPGKVIWGVGPSLMLPTASSKQAGSGKWSVGPTVVVLGMPGPWVIGALAYNVWSFAGDPNRPNVNSFEFQYFINYNIANGWYVFTSPIITADWTAKSHDRWTLPWGMGGGHVFYIGKQAINMSLQAYANSSAPQETGANWTTYLTISFLFPK